MVVHIEDQRGVFPQQFLAAVEPLRFFIFTQDISYLTNNNLQTFSGELESTW